MSHMTQEFSDRASSAFSFGGNGFFLSTSFHCMYCVHLDACSLQLLVRAAALRMAHGRLAQLRQELRHDLARLVGFGERLGGPDRGRSQTGLVSGTMCETNKCRKMEQKIMKTG